MEIRLRTKLIVTVAFILGVFAGPVYGQETPEMAPEAEIIEETTTTTPPTPEDLGATVSTGIVVEPPRVVSPGELAELENAQLGVTNSNAVFNYVLGKIIRDYNIDIQAEVLNIKTGAITPRIPAATQ